MEIIILSYYFRNPNINTDIIIYNNTFISTIIYPLYTYMIKEYKMLKVKI